MRINYKRSLKFLTLLISAILIGTVSAAIYDYMYLNATIGVQGMYLEWLDGDDATEAGTTINGVTATLANLVGPPNGTRVFPDPVRLNNTGASTITFNLTIDSVSGAATVNMSTLYVKIYNMNTSSLVDTLTIWETGAEGSDLTGLSIDSANLWRFQWEVTWKDTALPADTITVNLKLEVPV